MDFVEHSYLRKSTVDSWTFPENIVVRIVRIRNLSAVKGPLSGEVKVEYMYTERVRNPFTIS